MKRKISNDGISSGLSLNLNVDDNNKNVETSDSQNNGRAKNSQHDHEIQHLSNYTVDEADCSTGSKFVFNKIETKNCFDKLINTLPKNVIDLDVGHINCGPIMFSNEFSSLTKLKLGDIEEGVTVTLSDSLLNLKELSLGHISGTVILPPSSDNIESIDIQTIWFKGILQFPASLSGLKSLSIVGVLHDGVCKLPTLLDNLTTLVIGEAYYDTSKFTLPNSLPNLTELAIGEIKSNYTLKLPDNLDKLSTIIIQRIGYYGNFQLPNVMNNLTVFTIENILATTIKLPSSLLNTNFTIKSIRTGFEDNKKVNITLPDRLNNPTALNIDCINAGVTLTLTDSSHNLNTLIVGRIQAGVTIVIRDASHLTALTIQEMHETVTFQSSSPTALKNISNLTIGNLSGEEARRTFERRVGPLDYECSIQ